MEEVVRKLSGYLCWDQILFKIVISDLEKGKNRVAKFVGDQIIWDCFDFKMSQKDLNANDWHQDTKKVNKNDHRKASFCKETKFRLKRKIIR